MLRWRNLKVEVKDVSYPELHSPHLRGLDTPKLPCPLLEISLESDTVVLEGDALTVHLFGIKDNIGLFWTVSLVTRLAQALL